MSTTVLRKKGFKKERQEIGELGACPASMP